MHADTDELLHDPLRFKWITAIGQRSDDGRQTLLTRSHEVVQAWAAKRRAEPATGRGKIDVQDGGTGLRFDFPGMGRFQPISWDEWFKEFDEYDLVFVFREQRADGHTNEDYRIVTRERLTAMRVPPSGS